MAAAQMKKTALLEDQNMLLLMTMPDDKITTAEAREYLRLRRGDELKKLRRKLAHERRGSTWMLPPRAPNAVATLRRNGKGSRVLATTRLRGRDRRGFAGGRGCLLGWAQVWMCRQRGRDHRGFAGGMGWVLGWVQVWSMVRRRALRARQPRRMSKKAMATTLCRWRRAAGRSAAISSMPTRGIRRLPSRRWVLGCGHSHIALRKLREDSTQRVLPASIEAGWTWIGWIHVNPPKATIWVHQHRGVAMCIGVQHTVVGL